MSAKVFLIECWLVLLINYQVHIFKPKVYSVFMNVFAIILALNTENTHA